MEKPCARKLLNVIVGYTTRLAGGSRQHIGWWEGSRAWLSEECEVLLSVVLHFGAQYQEEQQGRVFFFLPSAEYLTRLTLISFYHLIHPEPLRGLCDVYN